MPRDKLVPDSMIHGILGNPEDVEEISFDDLLNPNHTALDHIADPTYPDPFTVVAALERERGYPLALDAPILRSSRT